MSSEYRVEFSGRAARQFRKLTRETQTRLAPSIDALASDPRPDGARQLSGNEDLWRIRVGAYRVVYTVEDSVLVVLVITLGHRRDVYRGV